MSDILINDAIPRTMTREGLEFLGRLARLVPKNGLIVEIGPLFGSSTWVLAKNSHPSVRVISIDTWERQPWIEKIEANYPGCKTFSKDAFDYYVRDCPNVEPRQGFSPDIMKGWNEKIDLFFDDATHGDPGFSDSLNFYLPKLKPDGIACGDDFASGWPDIVRGVYKLAKDWKSAPEVIGRVWALAKPDEAGQSRTIYSKAGPYSPYDLAIAVRNVSGGERSFPPGAWAGSLHELEPISAIKVDWAEASPGSLTGVIQAKDSQGIPSRWFKFGEWVEVDGTISSLRGHLVGPQPEGLRLSYQACGIVTGRRNSYTRNTRAFRDCDWTAVEGGFVSKSISALRCQVLMTTKATA